MMEYKGYIGNVELDREAGILHGDLVNTCDVITFQAESVADLTTAFHDSIDDYLAFCRRPGEKRRRSRAWGSMGEVLQAVFRSPGGTADSSPGVYSWEIGGKITFESRRDD